MMQLAGQRCLAASTDVTCRSAMYTPIRNCIIHFEDVVGVRCAEEVSVCLAVSSTDSLSLTLFTKIQFTTMTTASLILAHFYTNNQQCTVCLHNKQRRSVSAVTEQVLKTPAALRTFPVAEWRPCTECHCHSRALEENSS